ncbi:MAG TPA: peptide deformylase [Candidatus Saccharimonadales bacterium]|nr:peptide deformylase [Candidatus Saccharimonadales bacterium]
MTDRTAIINLPNPHLRTPSKRVRVIGDEEKAVIDDMKAAALDWEDSRPHEIAVALAAVQIDRLVRIVIVRGDFDNKEDRSFVVLINPEITKREGEIITDHEGCLSVKDVYGLVPRHSKIRVRALDESGQQIRIKADGFLARILQHEIDHTNGICFVDHIENDKSAFYRLTEAGELESVSYDEVQKSHILRD